LQGLAVLFIAISILGLLSDGVGDKANIEYRTDKTVIEPIAEATIT